jgi:hypothetical protein
MVSFAPRKVLFQIVGSLLRNFRNSYFVLSRIRATAEFSTANRLVRANANEPNTVWKRFDLAPSSMLLCCLLHAC